jgi:hypothetical protein
MEKDLLTGLLEKAYNKTPEEVSELLYQKPDDSDEVILKENAIDLILDLDGQRVTQLKTSATPDKEQIKKLRDEMRSEVLTDFEKKLKARYNIESSSQGLDLVQEVVDTVSDCDISEEKIKQNPVFLEMEDKMNKRLEQLQEEYDDYKLNQDKRTRLNRVEQDVLNIFASLNPIESPNTTVANTRRNDYLRKFESYDFEIQEDGNHFVKKDGKRVEDKHGNPVKFQDFVKDMASRHYEFAQSDGGSAGNKDGGKSGSHTDVPKDEKEYLSKMNDLMLKGDREGVVKLREAWELSKKS